MLAPEASRNYVTNRNISGCCSCLLARTAFGIADVDKHDKLSVTELPHAIGEFERMYPDAFQNDGSDEDDIFEEDGISEDSEEPIRVHVVDEK